MSRKPRSSSKLEPCTQKDCPVPEARRFWPLTDEIERSKLEEMRQVLYRCLSEMGLRNYFSVMSFQGRNSECGIPILLLFTDDLLSAEQRYRIPPQIRYVNLQSVCTPRAS